MIDIKEGQTFEDVYANIRDYCEMMNVDVVPVNAAGVECELAAATNLSFTSVIYGASQKLNITTDNANLAQKLGINGVQTTEGTDAKVTLDTTSGFSNTATVFINGGQMEVSDRDGFRMLFDISNAKAGSDATVTMLDAGYVAIQIGANEGQSINISIPCVNTKRWILKTVTYVPWQELLPQFQLLMMRFSRFLPFVLNLVLTRIDWILQYQVLMRLHRT